MIEQKELDQPQFLFLLILFLSFGLVYDIYCSFKNNQTNSQKQFRQKAH